MTDLPDLPDVLVGEGVDPLDDLAAFELSAASRAIRCDIHAALQGTGEGAGRRWDALPALAWVWAKRTHPTAKLEPFTRMKPGELVHLLGLDRDDAVDELPADELPVEQDPTGPAHESS